MLMKHVLSPTIAATQGAFDQNNIISLPISFHTITLQRSSAPNASYLILDNSRVLFLDANGRYVSS